MRVAFSPWFSLTLHSGKPVEYLLRGIIMEYFDEDLENEYEDVTTFANDVEKVLSKVGIKVRDTNHDFRDTQDILDDIAKSWDTYTDLERNSIATAVAGKQCLVLVHIVIYGDF